MHEPPSPTRNHELVAYGNECADCPELPAATCPEVSEVNIPIDPSDLSLLFSCGGLGSDHLFLKPLRLTLGVSVIPFCRGDCSDRGSIIFRIRRGGKVVTNIPVLFNESSAVHCTVTQMY